MPPQRSPFARLFADLASALGELRVDWYLFGAQAALLYGATRVTADVDVTVRLGTRQVDELIAGLNEWGFELRVNSSELLMATRVLPLLHTPSRIPADVVLAGPGLEDAFIERSVARDLGGVTVFVAAPEDLVVMAKFHPARRHTTLTVGQSVRIAREFQEMTQAELAAKSNITQATLSGIECDRVALSVERAKRLARALKVHPAVLLFPAWEASHSAAE